MAVGDGRSERILRFAHVFSLVLREHFDDHERALSAPHVHVDLEVLARSHRLAVKVPGDSRRRHAAEEDSKDGPVAVGHRLVPQRHREPRRFFLFLVGHGVPRRRRRHAGRHYSGHRASWSGRWRRLLELNGNFVARCRLCWRGSRYRRDWLFGQCWQQTNKQLL